MKPPDDKSELDFWFRISNRILRSKLHDPAKLLRLFFREQVGDKIRRSMRRIFEFYSVSFGQRDNERQWRSYGGNGKGVAIGFDPKFFEPRDIDNPTPDDHIYVGQVLYGEKDARARHALVVDEVAKMIAAQDKLRSPEAGVSAQKFFREMAAAMYVEIILSCITTKDFDWNYQNETRLVTVNYLNAQNLRIENAETRPRVVPRQPFLKQCIAEVMVGPKADADATERVRALLDSNGLTRVPVTRSIC